MRNGLDVSNWTGAPTPQWDTLPGLGYGVLFPQAIDPPSGYPPGCTHEQVQWALDNGLQVVPYIWKWFGVVDNIKRALDLLTPFVGQIDALALDVEDTYVGALRGLAVQTDSPPAGHFERIKRQPQPPSRLAAAAATSLSLDGRIAELEQAYELLDAFPVKLALPAGYYGARWYHVPYLGNTNRFAGRWLWVASYDGVYDPSQFQSFGGWSTAAVKQPDGTSTIGGVGNVDPDVVADGALEAPAPPPDQPSDDGPVDWPWQRKRARVIAIGGELRTVADQLEAAQDLDQVHALAAGVRDRADEILG